MSKKIGIFGLGKSGIASATYFRNKGYDVYVWDDSEESRNGFDVINTVKIETEKWPWNELSALVLAPGIPLLYPAPHGVVATANKHNVEVICDIEILMRDAGKKAKFIGITGTNGKSTTTALLYHVLKECGVSAQMGGNIGIAALSLNAGKDDVFVLEVSSYQIDLLKKAKFNVAVLLNITPDHLDRYGPFENYVNSKKAIFNNQNEEDVAIVCVDQIVTNKISKDLEKGSHANLITYVTDGSILKNHEFSNLPGEHNKQNIIAAYLAAKCFVKDESKILAAIRSFHGLPHRIENVFENAKIKFINDSKATNAEATEPAMKTFDNIYWMAGGVPKEGGITLLEKYKDKIKYAYFYGQAGPDFAETYKSWGMVNYNLVKTFDEAFAGIAAKAMENSRTSYKQCIVMLSPCCASFDEFNNYEHRGAHFKELALKFAKDNGL